MINVTLDNSRFQNIQLVVEEEGETIYSPVPVAVEWHRLTNWKYAGELFIKEKSVWNTWKRKTLIPRDVVEVTEAKYGAIAERIHSK